MVTGYNEAVAPPYRRRRRRWPWVLIFVVLLLAGLVVAADRIAVGVAEDRIADRLDSRRPFSGKPSVSINGFPFLTQATVGKYNDIEVTGGGNPVDKLGVVHLDAHLRGVHLKLSDALNHVSRVPVDRVDVVVAAPLSQLAAATGIAGLTLTGDGDRVTARLPISVPFVGTYTAQASVTLNIDSAGLLSANIISFGGIGVSLPSEAQSAVRRALSWAISLADLPFSSAAVAVRAVGDNVEISGRAADVVLQ